MFDAGPLVMGEWAELVLEGTLCEVCGEFVDDRGEGVPRQCCTCEVQSMTFFPPLPSKTFGLILADPPWRFKTYDGLNRKIERHYSLTALELLKMLDVESIADRHAVLVLWATQAQLHDALELMPVWGFRFKTAGAWAKQSRSGRAWQFGTGYLLRSAVEFFFDRHARPSAKRRAQHSQFDRSTRARAFAQTRRAREESGAHVSASLQD